MRTNPMIDDPEVRQALAQVIASLRNSERKFGNLNGTFTSMRSGAKLLADTLCYRKAARVMGVRAVVKK